MSYRVLNMNSIVNYVPLLYLYNSRLRNWRTTLGYLSQEFLPIAITLKLVYGISLLQTAVAFAGGVVLYECGYLFNDSASSACEEGGNRLPETTISPAYFIGTRILAFLLLAAAIYAYTDLLSTAKYVTASVGAAGLLAVHTLQWLRRLPFIRISTFSALAIYKYPCMVIPSLSWSKTSEILVACFLSYGLARVIFYGLRKYSSVSGPIVEQALGRLQLSFLFLFAPLLLSLGGRAAAMIWFLHLLVLLGLRALHTSRQLLKRRQQF